MNLRLLLFSALCLLLFGSLSATTIVPFPTQADMVRASDVALGGVVLKQFEKTDGNFTYTGFSLKVTSAIKGCTVGEIVDVYRMSHQFGDYAFRAAGDIELAIGAEYMLFLGTTGQEHLLPLTMGYGIYERLTSPSTNESFWVPIATDGIESMEHPSGLRIEPLKSYFYDQFPALLRASLTDRQILIEALGVSLPAFAKTLQARAFPNGCTTLFTGNRFGAQTLAGNRWVNPTLNVIPRTGGDPSLGNTTAVMQATVSALNAGYSGINLTLVAPQALPVNCTNSNPSASAPNNAGQQTIQIYFDDLCNQIPDLINCSGTLATGGSYVNSTHTYDGSTFGSNAWGYVNVNENSGCLGTTGYQRMMTHEMTHSMGLDHIPAGAFPGQNMNPSCCNPISARDMICMNYLYAAAPLPVVMTDFTALSTRGGVQLDWTTASESNTDRFIVQRSTNGLDFLDVGEVAAAGESRERRAYHFLDQQASSGLNYYRLQQLDQDGATELSDIVAVDLSVQRRLTISPNPAVLGAELALAGMSDGEVTITVSDVAGREVYRARQVVTAGRATLLLPGAWPAGLYYVRTTGAAEVLAQSVRLN